MFENRDSYVDKPVIESRTVYLPGNFNQIITFESKEIKFNSNSGFNNDNQIKFKVFAKITKTRNTKGDSSFNGISNYPNSTYTFKVPSGSKVKNVDKNYNIIHKKQRYIIDKIENIELEGLYFIFYCTREGDIEKPQNNAEQIDISSTKEEEKVKW